MYVSINQHELSYLVKAWFVRDGYANKNDLKSFDFSYLQCIPNRGKDILSEVLTVFANQDARPSTHFIMFKYFIIIYLQIINPHAFELGIVFA